MGYQATNTVSWTLVAYNMIGASLSKSHFNRLSGAGCHGVSYVGRTSIWPPGLRGPNVRTPVTSRTLRGYWSQTFRIFPVERIKWLLHRTIRHTVAVHYLYAAKLGIRAIRFMRCSSRTHFKGAGWSIECKLLLRAGTAPAGMGCHVSMLLEWQQIYGACVRWRPWLQSLTACCWR